MGYIAAKTIKLFHNVVVADQGNAYRMWLQRVLPHITDAYRQEDSPFRNHMGASGIGHECARHIWYNFHWIAAKAFSGRMLRLFNRGHMEEARIIALMLAAGLEVIQQDANGKQYKISDYGGHYSGSGDGMAGRVPDLPLGAYCLTEFKTHAKKSFDELAGKDWQKVEEAIQAGVEPPPFTGKGLREAKPMHYVQMQQYMSKFGLQYGLYVAVCKDNDLMYMEVIELDVENANQYTARAIALIRSQQPPERISSSPSWFTCKMCDYRPQCHMRAPALKNCRTCAFSDPAEDGNWYCMLNQTAPVVLDKAAQLAGCNQYTARKII